MGNDCNSSRWSIDRAPGGHERRASGLPREPMDLSRLCPRATGQSSFGWPRNRKRGAPAKSRVRWPYISIATARETAGAIDRGGDCDVSTTSDAIGRPP
jgi:hypothetical protein